MRHYALIINSEVSRLLNWGYKIKHVSFNWESSKVSKVDRSRIYIWTECPSLYQSDWARLTRNCNIAVRGSLHLLHSESVTFPALKNAGTHLFTWVEWSNYGKVPYSRTQHVGHRWAWTRNIWTTSLFLYPLRHTCPIKITIIKANKVNYVRCWNRFRSRFSMHVYGKVIQSIVNEWPSLVVADGRYK